MAAFLAALLFLDELFRDLVHRTGAPSTFRALLRSRVCILLLKAIATGRRRYWYGCVMAAGLAFCTLEVAFVLILTLAICCFIERDSGGIDSS